MLGFFFILSACALWAIDTLIRYPLIYAGVSSFAVVFYEHLFLSIIFLVVFFKSLPNFKKIKLSHLGYFFVIGGLGSAMATLAFTQAFKFLNPSLVILLQKFQPVVAIVLAKFVLKEKIGSSFILWAIFCLIGGFLISFEDIKIIHQEFLISGWGFFHQGQLLGYFLVMISVCGWGASTVFGKKLTSLGYQDEKIMAGRFIIGFLCLLPLLPFHHDIFSHNIDTYSKVSMMVLLSGLLAMYLYYHGLRKISARACSLTEMFFPFMAILVNWIFLDATLNATQLIGGTILLIGSVVIQLRRY